MERRIAARENRRWRRVTRPLTGAAHGQTARQASGCGYWAVYSPTRVVAAVHCLDQHAVAVVTRGAGAGGALRERVQDPEPEKDSRLLRVRVRACPFLIAGRARCRVVMDAAFLCGSPAHRPRHQNLSAQIQRRAAGARKDAGGTRRIHRGP